MGSISLRCTSLTQGTRDEVYIQPFNCNCITFQDEFHLIDVGFAGGLTPLLQAFRRLMTLFTSL